MSRFAISTIVLGTTLALAVSEQSHACQNDGETVTCFSIVAQSEPVVQPRVANLTVLNPPPIETLTAQSDYTVFLQPNVPAELQRRALRILWLSDPIFAYRDGLVIYAEDYTRPGDLGYEYKRRGLGSFARVLER